MQMLRTTRLSYWMDRGNMPRWGRQRTLIHRADSTSICDEDVQTTEVGYGGSDNLLSPRHIPHVGREDKDLGRGALTEDGVSARVEGCLTASHESKLCAGAGVLERDLGADAARCTSDQHHLPRECLRLIMHLRIDSRIDTGDRWSNPGETMDEGTRACWTHSSRVETLRSSSKPMSDSMVAVIEVMSFERFNARGHQRGMVANIVSAISSWSHHRHWHDIEDVDR
jgi:hypothetical protein